jgi:formate hydrogenlyase transcriptional activator
MKKSEDEYRVMVDETATILWRNLPDGSNEFLNQRWHDYTGLSPQEAHGWGMEGHFSPRRPADATGKVAGSPGFREPGESEARLRRFDGEYRWFLVRAVPYCDERGKMVKWYGSSTDIEDRKRAEEKLQQDQREHRRITDAIPQTIVIQRPDGIPIYANQAVLDYAGLRRQSPARDS